MKVAALLIDNATKNFDRIYYYEVPSYLLDKVKTGVRVNIPFGRGNSIRLAYFLDFIDYKDKGTYKLKQIINIVDEESVMSKRQFKLAKEIRNKYFCTYSQAINIMIPSGAKVKKEKYALIDNKKIRLDVFIRENPSFDLSKIEIIEKQYKVVNSKVRRSVKLNISPSFALEIIENFELSNEKQIRLIELLLDYEYITITDLNNYENISKSTVNTLAKKGYISIFDMEIERVIEPISDIDTFRPSELTAEQDKAINIINESLEKKGYDRLLIKGVTGSGKTEIYLNIANSVIKSGKQVIILVPEISLTPMMIRQFLGRFNDNVAILHSRLSVVERFEQWKKIKDNKVSIALGARSCLFAPFDNLGLIIIDEEHENSYKSETTPKYSAIDVANMRCKIDDCLLLLGSATPSIYTYNLFKKESKVIELHKRVSRSELPKVTVVDMREELIENNNKILSEKLKFEINNNIKKGEQTLLFINRRGYDSIYICKDCGYTIKCDSCDISMTYHKKRNILVCHKCGKIKQLNNICPNCKSENVSSLSIGTQKIEEYIQETFPKASFLRMDLDTTGLRNSHMKILDKFKNEKVDILIGTQMIAKGHDFPNITLVGILSADALTKSFSIYGEERAFQLITQAVGRAGRGNKKGRAIIQAFDVDNHAIIYGISQDYNEFYDYEIKLREQLEYPPFGIIGKVLISSNSEKDARFWASKCEKILGNTDMNISYSAKAPVYKINNKYRYRIIIKGYNSTTILKGLKGFYNYIYKKLPKNVKCSIDIDGIEMI